MKKYIVIYTDFGDTCDGFARVLGVYDTKEEANSAMNEDIDEYSGGSERVIDFPDRVLTGSIEDGRQWQILEV